MPFAPSSFLLLIERPGAPRSVLVVQTTSQNHLFTAHRADRDARPLDSPNHLHCIVSSYRSLPTVTLQTPDVLYRIKVITWDPKRTLILFQDWLNIKRSPYLDRWGNWICSDWIFFFRKALDFVKINMLLWMRYGHVKMGWLILCTIQGGGGVGSTLYANARVSLDLPASCYY